jgi:MSHA biogenesis protein MshL
MKPFRHHLALLLSGLLLPALAAAADGRFNIAVANTPARTFFAGLSDGTGQNILLEDGVSGMIDLSLQNVTLLETLTAVQQAYGYDFRPMPGGFIIEPAAMKTQIFEVNYLDLDRRGSSRTLVSSGQVSDPSRPGGGVLQQAMLGNMGMGMGMGQVGPNGQPGPNGMLDPAAMLAGSSVNTRSESDFWVMLEASLQTLVGSADGRSVVINAMSGIVAVRAMPRELRRVQDYLDRIQNVVVRQVVLEAKILEVTLDDGFQAGINWAIVGQDGNRTIGGFQRAPGQGFGGNLLDQPRVPITVGPGNPVTSLPSVALGAPFTLAIDSGDFNAFIELLKSQGRTRVLSSPRVSTINNQKAVIKAGSDEFFVTNVQSNTVVGTAAAANRNVELTPFFSGIALDVTPQVASDGNVILHIHQTVSDVTERVKTLTIADQTDELPLAFSQVRESDSVVKARSGQVIVIGGLMRTSRRQEDYRTPVLGDIPGLGLLFRSRRQVEQKTELVILLRPVVVERDDQWAALVDAPLRNAIALDPDAGKGIP